MQAKTATTTTTKEKETVSETRLNFAEIIFIK